MSMTAEHDCSLAEPDHRALPGKGEAAAAIRPHNMGVAAIWNAPGREYERISRSIADSIEHCVDRLHPQPGERILDVATGTGWTARRVAERGGDVVAIDVAADLVAAGRAAARAAGLVIDFRVGDAERLDFADASFDAVISTCGVIFARDPEAAAGELARICRKGGRLAFTAWPADGAVAGLFAVMKPYLPLPAPPVPPSPFDWGSRERVAALLGREFDLRFETGTTVLRAADSEAVWQLFVASYGPTRTLVAKLPPERVQQLRSDFLAYHDRYRSELGIALPRDYLVVVGVRR